MHAAENQAESKSRTCGSLSPPDDLMYDVHRQTESQSERKKKEAEGTGSQAHVICIFVLQLLFFTFDIRIDLHPVYSFL